MRHLCGYCSVIHSVLKYAWPVWHPGLTKNCQDTEHAQKHSLELLYHHPFIQSGIK